MENNQPIIVKRVKKSAAGHHGGAWKIAFADFATAMMAFFLVMWLMSSATPEQKKAISGYFQD
ncbi:MAG: motility protein MotB, partial [Pseudomonas sp.]